MSIFKQKYIEVANPVFPTTLKRAREIYNTLSRTISSPNATHKEDLYELLCRVSTSFSERYSQLLQNQQTFHNWFQECSEELIDLNFTWRDKKKNQRQSLCFGHAQKFIGLITKDWWALSSNDNDTSSKNLYAPLDGILLGAVQRYTGENILKNSYTTRLTIDSFLKYQDILDELAQRFKKNFNFNYTFNRLEIEQLIWYWV